MGAETRRYRSPFPAPVRVVTRGELWTPARAAMYKQERIGGNVRAPGDPRDVDDWCVAFLQDLDGLNASPTAERPRAAAAVEADDGRAAERQGGGGRQNATPAHEAPDADAADVLGKRSRATACAPTASHAQPADARAPAGAPTPAAERTAHLPPAMGPYRSVSVHSVESTLSNQVDHHALDDGDGFELDAALLPTSPPPKRRPASLPTGAPPLHRRAFSEGAQDDDDVRWQRGATVYAGPHYAFELRDDDLERDAAWSFEGDELSSARSGPKTAPWTRTEDQVISEAVKRFGCKWGVLSALLPGRTDNAVRNRWHRLERARKWRDEMATSRHTLGHAGGLPPAHGARFEHVPREPAPALLPAHAVQQPGPRTSGSGGYKCGRCGQPKRGHLCTVTLESDARVYEAAQDKMRQLHLEQADRRSSHAALRRRPTAPGEAGGGATQPAHHALPKHATVVHAAAAASPLLPAASVSPIAHSIAAQRQQAQRAQAHAQRQHQLAMQAQLRAHHAHMQAQRMAVAAQGQPVGIRLHGGAAGWPPAAGGAAGRASAAPFGLEAHARGAPVGIEADDGLALCEGGSAPSPLLGDVHTGIGHPGISGIGHPGISGIVGGLDSIDLLQLQMPPAELLHFHALLEQTEAEAHGAPFSPLGALAEPQREPSAGGAAAAAGGEVAAAGGEASGAGGVGGGSCEYDAALASFVAANSAYAQPVPPGLDRALSAPAGLQLDDRELNAGHWPQTPGRTPLAKPAAPAGRAQRETGSSAGVPSPTATAA
ncbi:hypothetical protein KFE25_006923 [Diacronema lutheri]|uniref:Uncharacterized protein n=1 Tax=Diacronema lutheri TaxID=2081491 RepID=A0A8J6CE80_DIALT|nr:hypothetical protein KFE25_006923 [Diacronema lutheri]